MTMMVCDPGSAASPACRKGPGKKWDVHTHTHNEAGSIVQRSCGRYCTRVHQLYHGYNGLSTSQARASRHVKEDTRNTNTTSYIPHLVRSDMSTKVSSYFKNV